MPAPLLSIVVLAAALHGTPPAIQRIEANSSGVAAGKMNGGALRIDLEARLGRWMPAGDSAGSEIIQAFAEVGHRLQVPGPLIRARTGTRISVSIHNRLTESVLVVHGFR